MSICQCQGGGYLQSEITQGLQLLRHECGQTGAEPGGGRSANSYPILATIPCYIQSMLCLVKNRLHNCFLFKKLLFMSSTTHDAILILAIIEPDADI